jgi:PLP dependent protein
VAVSDVAARLASVRTRVRDAALRAGRDPSDVTLVAVSKLHSAAAIREAYAAGQRDFGENYAQELSDKAAELGDLPELRFHFIGHLQRNKAKLVAPRVSVVHTVDSLSLAEAIERRADGASPALLIQVNVAGEAQKSGVAPDEVEALRDAIARETSLVVAGLMTIPPAEGDPRPHFEALATLGRRLGLSELSMGMSDDLEDAIDAGATIVRVGTAIFGPRP